MIKHIPPFLLNLFENPVIEQVDYTEQGGFEPPVPGWVQLLSREPDSATLAPLQITCLSIGFLLHVCKRKGTCDPLFNGAGGIRTPGTSQHNGFQDRRLKPLGHRSLTRALY